MKNRKRKATDRLMRVTFGLGDYVYFKWVTDPRKHVDSKVIEVKQIEGEK